MRRWLTLLALAVAPAWAQCVMCFRTAAAQQMERARVLNAGIIILLIPPFLILGGFLYLAYRRRHSYAGSEAERSQPDTQAAQTQR